jgi:hypothetical protein
MAGGATRTMVAGGLGSFRRGTGRAGAIAAAAAGAPRLIQLQGMARLGVATTMLAAGGCWGRMLRCTATLAALPAAQLSMLARVGDETTQEALAAGLSTQGTATGVGVTAPAPAVGRQTTLTCLAIMGAMPTMRTAGRQISAQDTARWGATLARQAADMRTTGANPA